jgi:hypothetical protein
MATAEEADFDKTARIAIIWQITARQLIVAGNLLREGHEAVREKVGFYASRMPILLLYGLAAENLVKGILVAKGIAPVEADKKGVLKLSEDIKGHNLEILFGKAGIGLSERDKGILNNLSWTVQAGKYPVGTKPAIHPADPTPVWLELTDLRHVCQLLETLEDALRSTGEKWVLAKEDLAKLGLQ